MGGYKKNSGTTKFFSFFSHRLLLNLPLGAFEAQISFQTDLQHVSTFESFFIYLFMNYFSEMTTVWCHVSLIIGCLGPAAPLH